ncbi:MAG: hypothetical protein N3G20_03925, partial [Verrucomicrobiae bacterium]|nr:hypothetical protein [Verrucomicrobiae bacterium]
ACPVTKTRCPPVATDCATGETVCPPVLTKCPPTPTVCVRGETVCPAEATVCPAEATKCPVVLTRCPVDPSGQCGPKGIGQLERPARVPDVVAVPTSGCGDVAPIATCAGIRCPEIRGACSTAQSVTADPRPPGIVGCTPAVKAELPALASLDTVDGTAMFTFHSPLSQGTRGATHCAGLFSAELAANNTNPVLASAVTSETAIGPPTAAVLSSSSVPHHKILVPDTG